MNTLGIIFLIKHINSIYQENMILVNLSVSDIFAATVQAYIVHQYQTYDYVDMPLLRFGMMRLYCISMTLLFLLPLNTLLLGKQHGASEILMIQVVIFIWITIAVLFCSYICEVCIAVLVLNAFELMCFVSYMVCAGKKSRKVMNDGVDISNVVGELRGQYYYIMPLLICSTTAVVCSLSISLEYVFADRKLTNIVAFAFLSTGIVIHPMTYILSSRNLRNNFLHIIFCKIPKILVCMY